MTKDFQMTNVKTAARTAFAGLSFELRHYLVIMVSSLVIS